MKRKEIIKKVEKSIKQMKEPNDFERGYLMALIHFEMMLKDKRTK